MDLDKSVPVSASRDDVCDVCKSPRDENALKCPHCEVAYGARAIPDFDNALQARAEAAELEKMFTAARAQYGHSDEWITKFEEILDRSFAVMCRDLSDVFRVVVQRGDVTRAYLGGIYRFGNEKEHELWEERRDHAERGLFPKYGAAIKYGNLSTTGRGIGGKFGDCVMQLRDVTYQHRASVFIDNSAKWYEETVIRSGGFGNVPKGYRAEWSARAKLAYIKLAPGLPNDQVPNAEMIEEHLVPNWPDASTYIEVNILGSVTRHGVKKYLFPTNSEGNYLYDRASAVLTELGIDMGGCVWTR